ALGRALLGHGGHVARNLWRSLFGAPVAGTPPEVLAHEARMLARLSAKYALTCDLAMGLLGGKLKRMELLSARLGDCLAHLYMASACLWRYVFDAQPDLLPFARAAMRVQLDAAEEVLRDLYANLPAPGHRFIGNLILSRTRHLAPLPDVELLQLARTLRTQPHVVSRLCPDLMLPSHGGMADLARALELGEQLGEEAEALGKAVSRTHSIQLAARESSNPALADAYLRAVNRVIQVDDFPGPNSETEEDAGADLRGHETRLARADY
ncbi:MAG: DUF1974 domain-containing protein, partial [Lysobacteraceae bacterium]